MIFYMTKPGGLMQCCTESLDREMTERWAAGQRDGEDGEVIACDHCSSTMSRKEGMWQWNIEST